MNLAQAAPDCFAPRLTATFAPKESAHLGNQSYHPFSVGGLSDIFFLVSK
jgi:hypothetical protein